MPVLYLGRNVNHISRVQFLSGFAPTPDNNPDPPYKEEFDRRYGGCASCSGNWAQRSRWKQARPCRLKGRDNWPR